MKLIEQIKKIVEHKLSSGSKIHDVSECTIKSSSNVKSSINTNNGHDNDKRNESYNFEFEKLTNTKLKLVERINVYDNKTEMVDIIKYLDAEWLLKLSIHKRSNNIQSMNFDKDQFEVLTNIESKIKYINDANIYKLKSKLGDINSNKKYKINIFRSLDHAVVMSTFIAHSSAYDDMSDLIDIAGSFDMEYSIKLLTYLNSNYLRSMIDDESFIKTLTKIEFEINSINDANIEKLRSKIGNHDYNNVMKILEDHYSHVRNMFEIAQRSDSFDKECIRKTLEHIIELKNDTVNDLDVLLNNPFIKINNDHFANVSKMISVIKGTYDIIIEYLKLSEILNNVDHK